MNYFLAKTEPGTYSIDDLERDRHTTWDGVTNPQAVRAIREMKPGDIVFIYHSGGVSSLVGMAAVKSQPRDDPKNTKSAVVDLEFQKRLGKVCRRRVVLLVSHNMAVIRSVAFRRSHCI